MPMAKSINVVAIAITEPTIKFPATKPRTI
jgi:hypothetical protein